MIFVLPVEGRNKRAIEPKRKEVKQKKHMWEKKLWIINWKTGRKVNNLSFLKS